MLTTRNGDQAALVYLIIGTPYYLNTDECSKSLPTEDPILISESLILDQIRYPE